MDMKTGQVELTEVLRQNDGPFVRVLNLVRSVRTPCPGVCRKQLPEVI